MNTIETRPNVPTLELILDEDDAPSTRQVPTQAMKLATLDRLDRSSEIIKPLRRLAPVLSGLLVAGGLLAAALLGRRRPFAFR